MRTTMKHRGTLILAGLVATSIVVTGCAATRERRGAPEDSGFLKDYSQLQENPDFPASLVYVRPGAQWSTYNAIQLDSVGLWVNESTKNLSPEDQQKLTDILYNSLHGSLSKVFAVSNQAGANTLRLRAALTQAQGAKVGLRVVTTAVPQLRMLGGVVGLAADTATTVGSATVEAEALDSVSNQRLAAVVDQRAGTKVLFAKRAYTTWGDVQAACDYWAARITWRLARLGVQRKAGVATPEEPSQSRSL